VLHPEKSKFVRMAFELYATGLYSLKTLKKELHLKTNVDLSKSALERILKDRFYIGLSSGEMKLSVASTLCY